MNDTQEEVSDYWLLRFAIERDGKRGGHCDYRCGGGNPMTSAAWIERCRRDGNETGELLLVKNLHRKDSGHE